MRGWHQPQRRSSVRSMRRFLPWLAAVGWRQSAWPVCVRRIGWMIDVDHCSYACMISVMTDRRKVPHGLSRPAGVVARRWNIVATAIALFTGLGAMLLPLGTRSSAQLNGAETTTRVSLLSSEGPSVLVVVAIPVLLVALPLMLRSATSTYRSRVLIVVLLSILVVLGAMSIGLFFVPTLIAMIVSVSAQASTRAVPTGSASHP